MKNLFALILLFVSISINAQNISVTDFRLDEMDLTANQQGTIVLDQNGEKCALIKVKTTQTGFSFDAGSLGVSKTLQKTAEIWVYVPHGVRKLSVSHQKYGSLEYALPVTTQKSKTYIMELKAETPLPVNHQRLSIKSSPANAVVMIDGNMVPIENGKAEITLPLGNHQFVAVANGYYQQNGAIELNAERPGRLTIDLEPTDDKNVEEAAQSITDTQEELQSNAPAPTKKITYDVNVSENENGITFTLNGVSFHMIHVGPGAFAMGSKNEKEEKPIHQVSLTKDLYIGETEVTQKLWHIVMGDAKMEAGLWDTKHGIGDDYPAYNISYHDALEFIEKLNEITNRQFRLPTEAEWEYAARGGNMSQNYEYSGGNNISKVGWYKKSVNLIYLGAAGAIASAIANAASKEESHPVKTKEANELGIYDMSGNVAEWCYDWITPYTASEQTNPTGHIIGSERVIRGGSAYDKDKSCRSTSRSSLDPSTQNYKCGFRLCL